MFLANSALCGPEQSMAPRILLRRQTGRWHRRILVKVI
jgi:hypothetical protein